MREDGPQELAGVGRHDVSQPDSIRANRSWWDAAAVDYQHEHGEFLGDADFVWGPEGLRERDARVLGGVEGRDVLEMGAGAAQCSRWLSAQGARVVATDLSRGQLEQAREVDARLGTVTPLVQADGVRLPFADAAFDVVFAAYGAVPFVADSAGLMREAARVLRPGGLWAFSTTHPVRWAFPDDPGPGGLTAHSSYFDRTPYAEHGPDGRVSYVEHHRTLGDRVREIARAGLVLEDLLEPEWPEQHRQVWGGWSPLRGALLPGTAIFRCRKPGQ